MKRLVLSLFALLMAVAAMANDASFYMSGNTLVPIKETDISVAKEILTITIGKDRYAKVDVYYEFYNPGKAKTLTMAFEADPPSYLGGLQNRDGVHPYIKDFTVTMNDVALTCQNAIVEKKYGAQKDFQPLDLDGLIGNETAEDEPLCDANELYNEKENRYIRFSYGYFFTAEFKKGLNTVHHTYTYHMNDNVYADYVIDYWLTPATRWAGGKIGDFTLRIKSERPCEEICLVDSLFMGQPWKVPYDQYFVQYPDPYANNSICHFMLAGLSSTNALEWHATDFAPDRDLKILPASYIKQSFRFAKEGTVVVNDETGDACIYVAEDDTRYLIQASDYGWFDKSTSHVEIRKAVNGEGCITSISNEPVYVRAAPSKTAETLQVIGVAQDIPDSYECLGYSWVRDGEWGLSHDWFRVNVYGIVGFVEGSQVMWEPYNIKVPEPPHDFYNYDDPESVIIPDGVTYVLDNAFYKCSDIKRVSFPASVRYLGHSIFMECTGLESVILPDSIKAVGVRMFKDCTGLKSVELPASVGWIQVDAFSGCSSLTSITLNSSTPPAIWESSFDPLLYKQAAVYVPKGSKEAYQSARFWKDFLNILEK